MQLLRREHPVKRVALGDEAVGRLLRAPVVSVKARLDNGEVTAHLLVAFGVFSRADRTERIRLERVRVHLPLLRGEGLWALRDLSQLLRLLSGVYVRRLEQPHTRWAAIDFQLAEQGGRLHVGP